PPEWTGYQLLALIFGTLLSSQGTDASFVLTLSNIGWGFPPGFRSFFVSDSIRLFRARFPRRFRGSALSRFPFPAVPTLSEVFHRISRLQILDSELDVPQRNAIPWILGGEEDVKPSLPNLSSSRQPFESTSTLRVCQHPSRDDEETSS
ncbi:hypothetical protein ACFWJT_38395, partial [Streptomyces sp. NPDC127069]|uniref:hypothetical protein n=1 Tax=Streptomyces sp. NPDC127069 TaxID=3347128 RepID=UPI003660C95C